MNNKDLFLAFVADWKNDFTKRIKVAVSSRKQVFTFSDAIEKSEGNRTQQDDIFIEYSTFVDYNPLRNNDYFKYLNSYKNGRKLDDSKFKHDLDTLHKYYINIDENSEYNPFSLVAWKKYVLFMLFKFSNLYNNEMDDIFGVKIKGNREYNPLTAIPKVLRANLPKSLKLKEYDIYRANPTFIDLELGIDRKEDVYSLIDKVKYNQLLNTHHEVEKVTIETVRAGLACVYGNRVDEVITDVRFNNKGQVFNDLTTYEAQYIQKIITANKIKNYVRLHDAIIVSSNLNIEQIEFDIVKFKCKEFEPPEVINNKKNFYYFNEKNEIITSPTLYRDFFEQEKFIRVTEQDNDRITIFKDSNNVVKPFNHKTDTVSFLSKNINEFDNSEVENRLTKDINNIINGAFLLLDSKELNYYSDKENKFGIPFKNGLWQYTKGNECIQMLEYSEVNSFFTEHLTQSINFQYMEYTEPCVFERFLTMVSVGKDPNTDTLTYEEENTRMLFFKMFGYLCHTYKDPTFSPAIILSDEGADDNSRKGGRGKTLITKALQNVQNTKIKGGNEFDGSYRHKFDDLSKEHKIYVLDDVLASFNYDDLYTNIIGDISCERKGRTAITIPFSNAPKFIITTNWSVRYDADATSTHRRFIEFKLTDYFNINNKPEHVFKHKLFDDWENEEWNRFYNFVYACVGYYLEFGLEAPKYDKNKDNFKANFSNDVILQEFERIFNLVSNHKEDFNVSDFLCLYNSTDNPLRMDKLFHKNNAKKLIDAYIKFKRLNFEYRQSSRKWFQSIDF